MEYESNFALPSPTDTPYRTPSSSRSRQTSRTLDMSPATTPPPVPGSALSSQNSRKRSNDSISGIDETLPLSDPRRFTPTLHASLVSEILSLRRDLESRHKDIDRLEQNWHGVQSQNESLNASLVAANRETRQVKRQMQMLEGGTLSAINELAKERDDAIKETADLRFRLEQAQKKAKGHEETVDQVQEQWQKDKESWTAEKRLLETKVHVVEGRLKVVLSEIAKSQMFADERVQSPRRAQSRASILESPSKRPISVAARRQSTNSMLSDYAGGKHSSLGRNSALATNLADELALELDDEFDAMSEPEDGRISPDALPEENVRPTSSLSIKARKVLGLPFDIEDADLLNKYVPVEPLAKVDEDDMLPPNTISHYVDAAIQYSRPSSPINISRESLMQTPTLKDRFSAEMKRHSNTMSIASMTSPTSAAFSIDTSDNAWEEILQNQPIMVSSACQTVEQLPSPPLTPKDEHVLSTITEVVETREIAIQTDPATRPPSVIRAFHYRNDTADTMRTNASTETAELQIPTIAIIPPTSRPITPEDNSVQLPPRTKSISCQVETAVLSNYTSTGIQTEEIRIDKRNVIPHPALPPPPPPMNAPLPPLPPKSLAATTLFRRGSKNTANSSMRRSIPGYPLAPINDNGPVSDGARPDIARPIRSSSMFAGFDEADEEDDLFEDDVFQDDDFFSRPTAKFVLQRGKLAEKMFDDIGESEAVKLGKRFALDNIRQSEDGLPPEIRDIISGYESGPSEPPMKTARRMPSATHGLRSSSSKSGSMRRAAMISNGAAAHQSKHSQSSLGSNESSRPPPPMPIPVRYSSARLGKSISDGGRTSRGSSNASPTRNIRRVSKPLRKARSGPAISPAAQAARRARSRSPPLDSRVSIVPEMPNFYMPEDNWRPQHMLPPSHISNFEASAPRPYIATGPPRKSTHLKTNSDAVGMEQTSVVDSIAQTMVGEWMFKYVRRRKSFGKPDKDWDPSKSVEEMSSNASSGVRHKRWVWLAPYEKTILWSSKQPTDGTSLLGKSGRKLVIKSVLDVKDDNPLPRGAVQGASFNRSILILTPQRALKFTATSQERHYIWLTALSFLSHSPIALSDFGPMPPPPPPDDIQTAHGVSPTASLGGSLRRRPIRDSIRIAKGSSQQRPQFRSFTTDGIPTLSDHERPETQEPYDPMNDAALPPTIRRYTRRNNNGQHARQRSNTGPNPGATASYFRSLLMRDSGTASAAPSVAISTEKGSSDRGQYTPSLGFSGPSTRRGSEASISGRPPLPALPNLQFYNDNASNSSHAASMSTMRMDAFMGGMPPLPGRAPLRNLRLGMNSGNNLRHQPSIRKDLNIFAGGEAGDRSSMSQTEIMTPTDLRFSESTGRGSSERDYFRGF